MDDIKLPKAKRIGNSYTGCENIVKDIVMEVDREKCAVLIMKRWNGTTKSRKNLNPMRKANLQILRNTGS